MSIPYASLTIQQAFYEAVAWQMYSHEWQELTAAQRAGVVETADILAGVLTGEEAPQDT